MMVDPEQAHAKAHDLERPIVVFDPTPNSLQGKFYLLEFSMKNRGVRPGVMPDVEDAQMTRQCFNAMKAKGMINIDLADRLKFTPHCQAWPVLT